MRLTIFFLGVLLSFSAYARSSPSDKFCSYLAANSAQNPVKKAAVMKDLMAIADVLMDIKGLEDEAIKQKMSFHQFQQMAKTKKSIKVPDSYVASYNAKYVDVYCGKYKTEAQSLELNGNNVMNSEGRVYDKQFNVQEHPYSKEIPELSGSK